MFNVDTTQLRDWRWVLAYLEEKGRRVRTVAIPASVKQGINAWMTAAGVEDGRLLRAVSKGGKVKESMSGWAVWSVVEQPAREIGIERFGAHDLRRTCAKLSAARTVEISNRSSSSSATPPSRRLNATSARNGMHGCFRTRVDEINWYE